MTVIIDETTKQHWRDLLEDQQHHPGGTIMICPSCGSQMRLAAFDGVIYYGCLFCDVYIPRDDCFRPGSFNDD